jgi:hypothetical protein
MRRLSGQAARLLARAVHGAVAIALTVALLAGTGLGVLAWRLGHGPITLPWLLPRIEAAADRALAPDRLRLGAVALAWEGFRSGLGAPLDLRLSKAVVLDGTGRVRMALPLVTTTLSLPALLHFRLAPRTLAIDHPRFLLRRSAAGTIGIGVGVGVGAATGATGTQAGSGAAAPGGMQQSLQSLEPATILAELARPPAAMRSPGRFGLLSQLRRLLVRNASLVVIDRKLGAVWRAPHAFLDLFRAAGGGAEGTARLGLSLGGSTANLLITAHLPAEASAARITAHLQRVSPAALAGSAPALAPLAAVAAPIGGSIGFTLGPTLQPRHIALALECGSGTLRIAGGTVPIAAAQLKAGGTSEAITLRSLRLTLPGASNAAPSNLTLRGSVTRTGDRIVAALALHLDQVAFERLPALWPPGLATDPRRWILENITHGEARDGRFTFRLTAASDFSHVDLSEAAGTLLGRDLVVHWFRPVPPLIDGSAELRLRNPDVLDIAIHGGKQTAARGAPSGLVVTGGTMRISGLNHHDQDTEIDGRISGSLPAALALLREPGLRLLARHPLPLVDPAGEVSIRLKVGLPLVKHLSFDQVHIGASAALSAVHLSRVAAGRDLDGGTVDLTADTDGLSFAGTGRLGGIPATLTGQMDFRAGPPDQVQQLFTATADTTVAALAAAGLRTDGIATGPVRVSASVTERRDGTGTVAAKADLTHASLSVAELGWRKPPGTAARLAIDLPLRHDQLIGTAPITMTGTGTLAGTARADFIAGHLAVLHVSRLRLGGTDLSAELRFRGDGQPIEVHVSGPRLDLAARFATRPPTPAPASPPPPKPAAARRRGAPWTLTAQFAAVRLAGGEVLSDLRASGANDGLAWQRLHLAARLGAAGRIDARIDPTVARTAGTKPGRSLLIDASNVGALAHGLGLPGRIDGGTLHITGRYGPEPSSVLTGTATAQDLRLRDAPVLARLLQAVTLYGVVEMLRGPGLGISRLIAPFSLDDGKLTLTDARAFSASLGVTAMGLIDFDRGQIALKGTIVPAYFFNSLLGHVPLIGRLFSPERGGGVFAASYAVNGRLNKPAVSVDPLTALTPGALRGLFKLF